MNVDNEIYDVVDKNDNVIGRASRKHIHANKLLHRSVHILVFNSKNELYLQKRSFSKDESPGLWDTSSAGHVDSGESYDDSAHRELWEELGLKTNLKTSIKIPSCQETCDEHIQVYICSTDVAITMNLEEISEGAFFSLSRIQKEISKNPAHYTSSFKLIFKFIKNIEKISLN